MPKTFNLRRGLVVFGALACLIPNANALDVTVNSEGGADYATVGEALDAIRADPDSEMNTITITGGGPYEEVIVIDVPLTLRGEDPENRPVIAIVMNEQVDGRFEDGIVNSAAVDMVFENLIFIPSQFLWPGDDGFDLRPLSEEDDFDITLRNCVITANDGNDAPVTTDGLALNEEALATQFGFGDDGFQVLSTFADIPSGNVDVLIEDVVVSHNVFDGQLDATGQDSFILGGENTEVTIRNTRISYGDRWGMQLLSSITVNIEGTAEEPVVIQGMGSAGILCFGGAHDWEHLHLIENGLGARIDMDFNTENNISNALVYGNEELGLGYFWGPPEERTFTLEDSTIFNNTIELAVRPIDADNAALLELATLEVSDTVFAGDPTGEDVFYAYDPVADTDPTIMSLNLESSAIVTEGPNALTLGEPIGVEITETGVLNSDPMFASTDPASDEFLRVTAPDYTDPDGDGEPLGGYFPYAGETKLDEWMMY